jgi:Mg/Co/Ni transporter MgtE
LKSAGSEASLPAEKPREYDAPAFFVTEEDPDSVLEHIDEHLNTSLFIRDDDQNNGNFASSSLPLEVEDDAGLDDVVEAVRKEEEDRRQEEIALEKAQEAEIEENMATGNATEGAVVDDAFAAAPSSSSVRKTNQNRVDVYYKEGMDPDKCFVANTAARVSLQLSHFNLSYIKVIFTYYLSFHVNS